MRSLEQQELTNHAQTTVEETHEQELAQNVKRNEQSNEFVSKFWPTITKLYHNFSFI